jgi:hypothetical protein
MVIVWSLTIISCDHSSARERQQERQAEQKRLEELKRERQSFIADSILIGTILDKLVLEMDSLIKSGDYTVVYWDVDSSRFRMFDSTELRYDWVKTKLHNYLFAYFNIPLGEFKIAPFGERYLSEERKKKLMKFLESLYPRCFEIFTNKLHTFCQNKKYLDAYLSIPWIDAWPTTEMWPTPVFTRTLDSIKAYCIRPAAIEYSFLSKKRRDEYNLAEERISDLARHSNVHIATSIYRKAFEDEKDLKWGVLCLRETGSNAVLKQAVRELKTPTEFYLFREELEFQIRVLMIKIEDCRLILGEIGYYKSLGQHLRRDEFFGEWQSK